MNSRAALASAHLRAEEEARGFLAEIRIASAGQPIDWRLMRLLLGKARAATAEVCRIEHQQRIEAARAAAPARPLKATRSV